MCLIINIPAGKSVPKWILCQAMIDNSDGIGIMYSDGRKLQLDKRPEWPHKDLSKTLSKLSNYNRAIHFRYATHGNVDIHNIHPFQVGYNARRRWCLMHNGVLREQCILEKEMSDTWHLCQDLKPILTENPDLMDNPTFRNMLKAHISYGNKLLFMDNFGKTYIINEIAGTYRDGCWYSNTNSFYKTMGYETGHKKSYSDSTFKNTAGQTYRQYPDGSWRIDHDYDNEYIVSHNRRIQHTDYKTGVIGAESNVPEVEDDTVDTVLEPESQGKSVLQNEMESMFE